MSLRHEQYRSLKITREFLRDLLDTHKRPKTVKELKNRVYLCLKNYPFLQENGRPIWSRDDFTEN